MKTAIIFLQLIIICLSFGAGLFCGTTHADTTPPVVADGYELSCLAGTPEGVRVYRLEGPKVIIPVMVVVSSDGKAVWAR